MEIKMTRKGDFVLRRLADEYVLIPYGATTEKMNQVLTLSETAAFIYEQTGENATPAGVGAVLSAWKSLRCAGGGSAGGCQRGAENISELRDPGVRNLRK